MLCTVDNSTAVSGSYVTAECEAYPVEGEGPFLVVVVVLFSSACLVEVTGVTLDSIRTGARWARHAKKENA